jgi:hypothetical protein
MDQYVVFEYLYRDASNYKSSGSVLLGGTIDEGKVASLVSNFEDGVFFIPEAIGIPELRSKLYEYGGPNSDDHEYHEFVCLRTANDEDIVLLKLHDTLDKFILAVAHANKGCLSDYARQGKV